MPLRYRASRSSVVVYTLVDWALENAAEITEHKNKESK
jgi:hypothetical protein